MSHALAADTLSDDRSITSPSDCLVLYDGYCGLCNRFVRFLLAIDSRSVLCFAPLQGRTAARIADRRGLSLDLSTVIYVQGFGTEAERVTERSEAALRAVADVGGVWSLVSVLRLVPRPIRDAAYGWVARHRFDWFGRYESCPMPPPEVRSRFLP